MSREEFSFIKNLYTTVKSWENDKAFSDERVTEEVLTICNANQKLNIANQLKESINAGRLVCTTYWILESLKNVIDSQERPFGDHSITNDIEIKENKWEEIFNNAGLDYDKKNYSKGTDIKQEDIEEVKVEDKKQTKQEIKMSNYSTSKNYSILKTCVQNDIPVYITGPAGCGKSTDAEAVAMELKLGEQVKLKNKVSPPEYFYPMNAIQQEFQIKGYMDALGNYNPTNFYKAFKFGGVLLLDELDASIPEVLVILNFAIANKKFEFPDNMGTTIAHKDFRVIASGNTKGIGNTLEYTGRYKLDAASLNRFVQLEYNYDKSIELKLANGNQKLLDLIYRLRRISETNNLNLIISYRQIMYITSLIKAGLSYTDAINTAILNSLEDEERQIISDEIRDELKG